MVNTMMVVGLLVTSNVLLTNGFGVISLQRNKDNIWFVLWNSFSMVLTILACCSLYSIIYTYVLNPYNVERLGILVIILFAGVANFGTLELTKLINKEMYYYYDSTYSFIINLATTIGVLLTIDFNTSFARVLVATSFVVLGYVIASLIFAAMYSKLHNKKVSRIVRPVPITILTMSIVAMIIYAISTAL